MCVHTASAHTTVVSCSAGSALAVSGGSHHPAGCSPGLPSKGGCMGRDLGRHVGLKRSGRLSGQSQHSRSGRAGMLLLLGCRARAGSAWGAGLQCKCRDNFLQASSKLPPAAPSALQGGKPDLKHGPLQQCLWAGPQHPAPHLSRILTGTKTTNKKTTNQATHNSGQCVGSNDGLCPLSPMPALGTSGRCQHQDCSRVPHPHPRHQASHSVWVLQACPCQEAS